MGGAERVLDMASASFDAGDYRWVAEVVNHVVFADPSNESARLLQADALEQLGYQAESGPWRDFYLTGAQELRSNGTILKGLPGSALQGEIVAQMHTELLLDLLGVRFDGVAGSGLHLTLTVVVAEEADVPWYVTISRGTLSATTARRHEAPDVTIETSMATLAAVASGRASSGSASTAGPLRSAETVPVSRSCGHT
jgi:alkyl sulfatase BDS1-like metallo-beta-lactamase superfamily hydrolase